MTVIRPNSISGVSSITGQGGDISIFRADGTAADVTVNNITSGVVTATTFSGNVTGAVTGSGANLTNLPAANLTGTLPAISGANLTGINTAFGNSSVNTSGIITATAFVPTVGQLSHRNLVINGAMTVAQRGTTSTSSGYATVDRFKYTYTGTDEAPTQAQVDVSSSDLPFTKGFTKAYKITNGNQTSGAGVGDYIFCDTRLEAQDIRNSGWNYLSSSSFLTLSFYVKSSVAQNFYGYVQSFDGTGRTYPFETGALTANTWTKITKTIAGNSGLGFDNDNNMGLLVLIAPFWGTNYTDSGVTLNQWGTTNGSARTPDSTATWYTTNDATFELTGVQLEVGPVATPFEHRNFNDEMLSCKRYYQKIDQTLYGCAYSTGSGFVHHYHNPEMRATPTLSYTGRATSSGFNYASYSNHKIFQCIMSSLSSYLQGAEWDAEL